MREENEAAVETLLEQGADPNTKTNRDKTPLHLTAATGNEINVKALLAKGEDPNIKNNLGETPLTIAISRKKDVVVIKEKIAFIKEKPKGLADNLDASEHREGF